MKRIILSFALTFGLVSSCFAQLKGTVYHDANSNGVRDASEKPIAGVTVSDGLHVVKTDSQGRFNLPGGHSRAHFVSVTTPSGYAPATHHYLKTTPAAVSYDFGLIRNGNPSEAFQFIHITDTEAHNYKEWIDNLKGYVAQNPTAFIVHTGDICYIPGLDFHAANVRTAQMGVPVYYTIGNHDLVAGDYGEQYFEQRFGPAWYSFEAGNVHFIVLPMLDGDHKPSYTLPQILAWMRNDLALADPAKKIVIMCHELWLQGDDLVIRHRSDDGKATTDSLDLGHYDTEAWIYGHWHNHYVKMVDGMKTICSSPPDKGGIDHSPSCFRVIDVDAAGNLTDKSRSVYTYINTHAAIAYPAQLDTVPQGTITARATAYRTVSPTRSVKATLLQGGKAVRTVALTQNTDWAWSGKISTGAGSGERELLLDVLFADGTRLRERNRFVVADVSNAVEPDQTWGQLAGNAQHNTPAHNSSIGGIPRCAWSQNAGSNIYFASPVVGDGRLFVATIDDDNLQRCSVIAYNAASGQEEWRYKTINSVKSSMAYADGILLVCDASQQVYALEGRTGHKLWSRNLAQSMLPSTMHGVAIEKGVLYAGQGSGLCAIDIVTGDILWTNTLWSGGESTSSTMTAGEGVVLASSHWNGLYAHNAASGELLWQKQDRSTRFRDGSPTICDGSVYLASSNSLFVIDPQSGEILRSNSYETFSFNAASAPLVTASTIYVATSNSGIAAFDRQSLKPKWNYKTAPALFFTVPYTQNYEMSVETTPLLVGDTLIFGASDGWLYGINADTGRFEWKRNMGAPIFSSPAVSGNGLYIADFSGNVWCMLIPR